MLNNLRILKTWTDYFHDPKGSNLGLLTALYSIGSIASLPIVSVAHPVLEIPLLIKRTDPSVRITLAANSASSSAVLS